MTIYNVVHTHTDGYDFVYDLDNGVTIYSNRDGTATDRDNGERYIAYSKGIPPVDDDGDYDNYQFIGWVLEREFNYDYNGV